MKKRHIVLFRQLTEYWGYLLTVVNDISEADVEIIPRTADPML